MCIRFLAAFVIGVHFAPVSHAFGQITDTTKSDVRTAATSGDVTLLESLLKAHPTILNIDVGAGRTLLYHAAAQGHTDVVTASAIVSVGATPVFAEVGADHLMDPEDTAARVTDRTRALMPTQLNGRTANMQPFQELVDTHDLILLEDSAQGLGSTFKGRMSGTFGLAGVFSFYPAKTLGALGDGGGVDHRRR